MEWVHSDYQSMYHIEVSKVVRNYWSFVQANTLGGMGFGRDPPPPRSGGV